MNDDNGNPRQPPEATSAAEPTGPPVDPAERPRIEPSDALPTDGQKEEPGLVETAKSFLSDDKSDVNPQPRPATSAAEPTPPPVDPDDRPRIEPSDALPSDQK